MKLSRALVVLDLETTGIWIDRDKIIEIAMIKCSPDGGRAHYHKRLNPGMPIPKAVSDLTGIKNEDVREAPFFKDIAKDVLDFLNNCDLGGFNIERFDWPLLKREIADIGLKHNWEGINVYDAQKVFHLNEKRDLAAAYNFYCRKYLDNAHSALADTQATLEILQAQVAEYAGEDGELASLSKFNYQPSAEFLDSEHRFRWWNGKVYMMFGKYAKRYSLQDIARLDPAYLQWIISAKFSDEVKTIAVNALEGRFPVLESGGTVLADPSLGA